MCTVLEIDVTNTCLSCVATRDVVSVTHANIAEYSHTSTNVPVEE